MEGKLDPAAVREARRLLSTIRWKSVDKDNMEFEARATCYQVDSIRLLLRALDEGREASAPLQARVAPWMQECFGPVISADRLERCDRFLEEALELVQAVGYGPDRARALIEYTFGRPAGEPSQEVGGVMITLAAFCLAHGLDMHEAGETELERISAPAVITKIRAKQAAKARDIPFSPLPQLVSQEKPDGR